MAKPTRDSSGWTDDLSIGIDVIDNDHKKLFDLLSQLKKINETRKNYSDEAAGRILSDLYAYTEYHFSREEMFMKVCAYPHYENHQQVHEMIKTKIKYNLNAFNYDSSSINLKQLQSYLESWLIDHIGVMDQNYLSYMKDKKDLIDRTNSLFEAKRRKRDAPEKRFKVLIVDDEEDICEAISAHAEKLNCETIYITEGKSFDKIYSDDVNVVFLDLFLPDIDGIEVIRYLADKNSKAAIILMSGKDSGVLHTAKLLAEERGLNVIGILDKPFGRREIHDCLVKVSNQKLNHETTTNKYLFTTQELREALDEQQIFPHFQPKVRIDTGKPVGFEALARWQHPEKGMISPGVFIPVYEKYDLIDDLTSLMMDKTFAQSSIWIKAGLQLMISINISALVMKSLKFPEQLLAKANAYNLDSSLIIIEVTESAMADELANSLDILARIRMKGFLLSIDDFGTGYSSMMQLNRAPFNELKIDQSFVKNMDVDEENRAICESTIDLGHKLNMTITAEGIETKAEWDVLKKFYCTEGQGYYFGKPMPANEFEAWYKDREG